MKTIEKKIIGAAVSTLLIMGTLFTGTRQSLGQATTERAPELIKGEWAHGKATTIAAQKGKVIILSFWTTNCINCKRVLPYWNGWAKKYASSNDVAVISVHTPETRYERSPVAVHRFAQKQNLVFPVLIDNDSRVWDLYKVMAWPTTILIDKNGNIRNRWEGELNYDHSGDFHKVENTIEMLRKESKK